MLSLDNGREISIVPTLREDAVAFEERSIQDMEAIFIGEAKDPNDELEYLWDITVEVWPR